MFFFLKYSNIYKKDYSFFEQTKKKDRKNETLFIIFTVYYFDTESNKLFKIYGLL
jgi:hypothetical protein